MLPDRVPFNDLGASYREAPAEYDAAALRVLRSGWYILGPEVRAFEEEFARYLGSHSVVGVASGTDALKLAVEALELPEGSEVITVANAGVPTISAIIDAGMRPVLVDVDEVTRTLDPERFEQAITPRTRAVIPIHLYGHPAKMDDIMDVARRHNIAVIEDCAQSHGARFEGRMTGTIGDLGCFSFYPTKNLGAFGDGGAVVTERGDLAQRVRRLREYGQVRRYEHPTHGHNSRLDEMQAALLRVKLERLDEHNAARIRVAKQYADEIGDLPGVLLPRTAPWAEHVYHLYVIQCVDRDGVREQLAREGIETMVHYPKPVHLQDAYRHLGNGPGSLPVTERLCASVLSLPMYPQISSEQVSRVVHALRHAMLGS